MRLTSYAKINLGLRVLRKRPDGYHDIETILQTIDLADTIDFQPTSGKIEVRCEHPAVPEDEDNLAYRAARLLKGESGTKKGVRITITKQIPVGAGLGGGSSNTAATLVGLNRLWNLNLTEEQLLPLAVRTGADVAFFLRGGTAYATGKGEKLRFLPSAPEMWLVLFYPGFRVSTAWAYKNLKMGLTKRFKYISLGSVLKGGLCWRNLVDCLDNDLEHPVGKRYPIIRKVKAALISWGALGVAMSGSGPTVYGIFEDEATARWAYQKLNDEEGEAFLSRPIKPESLL